MLQARKDINWNSKCKRLWLCERNFQVFLDGVREAPMHTLLRQAEKWITSVLHGFGFRWIQARSVAFGAPMCYGAAEAGDFHVCPPGFPTPGVEPCS